MGDVSDIEYWRGSVDTKLGTLELKVDKNTDTLDRLPDRIETRMRKVVNNSVSAPAPGNGQPVTFKWLVEKILLPVVILVASLIIGGAFIGG